MPHYALGFLVLMLLRLLMVLVNQDKSLATKQKIGLLNESIIG
jgi:cytochrome b561